MKRFHVFMWYDYEGNGGWNDHVASADTLEEAQAMVVRGENGYGIVDSGYYYYDNYHIVDLETEKVVAPVKEAPCPETTKS